jgi:hypothetical protein
MVQSGDLLGATALPAPKAFGVNRRGFYAPGERGGYNTDYRLRRLGLKEWPFTVRTLETAVLLEQRT